MLKSILKNKKGLRNWLNALSSRWSKGSCFTNHILECSPDGTKVLDSDGNILFLNPAAAERLSLSQAGNLLGLNWFSFWTGEAQIEAQRSFNVAKSGGVGRFTGYFSKGKNNAPQWCDVIVSPLYHGRNNGKHFLVVSRDVTESTLQHEIIKEGGDRLSLTLKAAAIGTFDWDLATDKHIWSEQTEIFFGYEPGTFDGTFHGFLSRIHPEDREKVKDALSFAFASQSTYHVEYRVLLPKNGTRWLSAHGQGVYGPDKIPCRLVGILIDITEQKNIELARVKILEDAAIHLEKAVAKRTEDLAKSQDFLNSLIENIPNMVFVKDAQELRFIRFNKAGEKLLGYHRSDLIGKNDFDFFPKEQAEFFTSKDRAVLAGKDIVDIPAEAIDTKVSGQRILHTKKIPIYGSHGKPDFLLGISEDITEEVRADAERLRIAEEKAILKEREQSSRRTVFLAEASTVLAASFYYAETLSRLAKLSVPILGDMCTVTMLKEDGALERLASVHTDPSKSCFMDELLQLYPADNRPDTGVGFVIKNGKSIFFPHVTDAQLIATARDDRHLELMRLLGAGSWMAVPIQARGKVLGALAFALGHEGRVFNLEDLALAEELGRRAGIAIDNALLYASAQKAIEARDEFLSIASHELKTPITSLKLQLDITKRALESGQNITPHSEKFAKAMELSSRQVDRLTSLVEDLLDVSKIRAGKLNLQFESVDLSSLIEEVRSRFHFSSDGVFKQIVCLVDSKIAGNWDRTRIEQIFLNLISNALKYAPQSPIVISASTLNDTLILKIQDFGPGIPKDKQSKVFERFERATNSRNISGLGLGLFIVKQIVEAHFGEITLESEVGAGTTFTIELPLNPLAAPSCVLAKGRGQQSSPSPSLDL